MIPVFAEKTLPRLLSLFWVDTMQLRIIAFPCRPSYSELFFSAWRCNVQVLHGQDVRSAQVSGTFCMTRTLQAEKRHILPFVCWMLLSFLMTVVAAKSCTKYKILFECQLRCSCSLRHDIPCHRSTASLRKATILPCRKSFEDCRAHFPCR